MRLRITAAAVAALLLVGAAAGLRAVVAAPTPTAPSQPVTGARPARGALIYEADTTPGGAPRARAALGTSATDHVRFDGSAIEYEVSPKSWAAITIQDLAPDDFVAEFTVAPVRGDGAVALWFRGATGRQVQVQLVPATGEITIQVVQSFALEGTPTRLFGPASRVPATSSQERTLSVSARGPEIVVYLAGAEIARATDAPLGGGAIGFLVSAGRGQSFVARLSVLRLYNPHNP